MPYGSEYHTRDIYSLAFEDESMTDPGRKPTVSDIEILRIFVLTPDPVFLASELTEDLDMSRQGVLRRLDQLESNDLLRSKKAGGRRIFWITHKGHRAVADSQLSQEN